MKIYLEEKERKKYSSIKDLIGKKEIEVLSYSFIFLK